MGSVPGPDTLAGFYSVFGQQTPLRHCTKLETLNLRDNLIQSIFEDWKLFLSNLTTLDLSHNRITSLQATDLSVTSRYDSVAHV